MSSDDLQNFRRRVQVDSRLHEALKRARAEATVAVGASAGFTFTAGEVLSSVDEASTVLSDEQLEAVAGGLLEMPFALDDDPLAELFLLLFVGDLIGFWPTVLVVLVTGALGTLGVSLDVSLKVLQAPELEVTRTIAVARHEFQALLQSMARHIPISAAAHEDGYLSIRVSGSETAVTAALGKLAGEEKENAYWDQLNNLDY
ncbi:MAG: Nif11-like leader peptide family RiPP precursor, partial [Planctomycetes bacterium]|nr:Nif11-like leader peptide family RiPP precursor [Planctomycetota bacterium]